MKETRITYRNVYLHKIIIIIIIIIMVKKKHTLLTFLKLKIKYKFSITIIVKKDFLVVWWFSNSTEQMKTTVYKLKH